MAATERIPVLVTGEQKAEIAERARAAKLSMGEFARRAIEAYRPGADDEALEGLVEQVRKTTEQASRAMDEALAFVDASRQRIDLLEGRLTQAPRKRKSA